MRPRSSALMECKGNFPLNFEPSNRASDMSVGTGNGEVGKGEMVVLFSWLRRSNVSLAPATQGVKQ